MSTKPTRKRTTTQRLGYEEGNGHSIKDEPSEEDGEEGETRGRRDGRRQRTQRTMQPPISSSSSQTRVQTQREGRGHGSTQRQDGGDDEDGLRPPAPNPFLPLHRLNRPGGGAAALTQGDMKISDIALSARQQGKWDRVGDTEKTQLVKAVVRLLLLKGSTNDKIAPNHVKDALHRINPLYQQHSQAALRDAQKLLKDTFGLNVETVKTDKESISNIFVVNDMRSPALQTVLSQQRASLADPYLAGYQGFCHLVFVAIWTAPGRSIDMLQLLRNVRKVDPRFSVSLEGGGGARQQSSTTCQFKGCKRVAKYRSPDEEGGADEESGTDKEDGESDPTFCVAHKKDDMVMVNGGGSRRCVSGSGIEELGGLSFVALVQRMVKEGYLKETKDATDPTNLGKRQVSLGTRFFVEVGLKQLARSYFVASGVPEDESVLQELNRERKGYITGNVEDEEDEEEEEEEELGYEEHKGGRR